MIIVSFPESTKVPAKTGLTVLDCRKRKRRHCKSQNCRAVWIFERLKPWMNVLNDQQSRELKIIRTTCPAVYVYDNANEYTWIRPWRNEEQKGDKEKLKKRYYAKMAVLQSLMSPWKKKGENKKKNYYNTGYSNLVAHPSTNPVKQGLTSLSGRNMFLVV